MTDEENTFTERVKRYAQVSTSLAGLAARFLGASYLGKEEKAQAEDVKLVLGILKGPLMKVAQLLATIPDALPPEYAAELAQLQSHAPPMGGPFVRRRMASELGSLWQENFLSFSHQASAAASLGQVHEGILKDGTKVACKLQYPNMEAAVEADLKQLKLAARVYEAFQKALETEELQEEIAERLREELDYTLEARHMALYRDLLEDIPSLSIPQAIPSLSTKRLLTMTWAEGRPLLESLDISQERKNALARSLFQAWYFPFYHYGIIHGDPHLGNYLIQSPDSDSYRIHLLDFGCIRKFPSSFVQGVLDLYKALETEDESLAVHAYEQWGFSPVTKDLVQILNLWARFLYKPLLEDKIQRMDQTNNSAYGREIAEKVHHSLRTLGGIRPPRTFLFMDRAAVGVGSAMMHLKAELNWYTLFHELTEKFDAKIMQEQQDQKRQMYQC